MAGVQQVGPESDHNWTYYGSNNDVPNILVFRPTWEEFKDFNKYMKYVESVGAHKAGIAKIIPPKEWVPRKNGYDMEEIMKMKIPDPICQEMDGTKGIFQSLNIRKNALSVKEFHKKSQDKTYRTPTYTNFEDLERKYWKNVTFVSPIYGADVPGSITDNDCDEWNIQRLGSCLDWINEDYNIKIKGVNTAYLYFGMWKTTFAWHTEDMDLHSINYLHHGESKFWYSIPPEYARRFERMAQGLFPGLHRKCSAYLRHKMCLISPTVLRQNSIPYNKIVQSQGEFMITFPMGYHSGFNTGFNIAESTNFATERWVEYGKRASRCYCKPDNVQIAMECFVKRVQPERYDAWLRGEDYGRHPIEPNSKPTPAPPPSAEEYLQNPQNRNKDIPICLLEPSITTSGKKRRHPIHKKKQDGSADLDSVIEGVEEKKIKFSPIQIQLKRIDEKITNDSSFDEKKPPSNYSTGKGSNNFSDGSCSTTPPKLSFITHPTFGSLPGKHEFGSGLVNNACWPTKVSTVTEEESKNDVKMTDTAKQNWMNSFLKKPSVVVHPSDLTKNQPSNSGKGNNLPPAPSPQQMTMLRPPSAFGGQFPGFHLRPPSLTATISKLQNSMPSMPPSSSYNNANQVHEKNSSIPQYNNLSTSSSNLPKTAMVINASSSSTSGQNYPSVLTKNHLSNYSGNGNNLPTAAPQNYVKSQDNNLSSSQIGQSNHYPEELRRVLQSTGVLKDSTTSFKNQNQADHSSTLESRTNMNGNNPPAIMNTDDTKMAVLLDPRFTNQGPQHPSNCNTKSIDTPRVINNKSILASNIERSIPSTMILIDRSVWQPPLQVFSSNQRHSQNNLQYWNLNGSVNVAKGEMYVRFDGPQAAKRQFCLHFRNILGTNKRQQNRNGTTNVNIWPPSDEMMNLCEDLSQWTFSASVDPFKDIKATVTDPWEKHYLLTIPVKLLERR